MLTGLEKETHLINNFVSDLISSNKALMFHQYQAGIRLLTLFHCIWLTHLCYSLANAVYVFIEDWIKTKIGAVCDRVDNQLDIRSTKAHITYYRIDYLQELLPKSSYFYLDLRQKYLDKHLFKYFIPETLVSLCGTQFKSWQSH